MLNNFEINGRRQFGRRSCLGLLGSFLLPTNLVQLLGQTTEKKKPVFHGLDFAPFLDGQSPEQGQRIPEEQIRSRMEAIAPYAEWIRTYGVSGGLEKSGAVAHHFGLKAAIGVWMGKDRAANELQLEAGIACAKAGDADMLVVGSETLLRQDLKTEQLCDYLQQAKKAVPEGVLVTTGDGYAQIQGNPDLIENVDVVFYNDYAYWSGVSVEKAIAQMDEHYSNLVEQAGQKPCWISEHGWPDGGEIVGAAEPTLKNAAAYLAAFLKWSEEKGVRAFYFEAFDEKWKSAHEGERGAHWGVWGSDGVLKAPYRDVVRPQK